MILSLMGHTWGGRSCFLSARYEASGVEDCRGRFSVVQFAGTDHLQGTPHRNGLDGHELVGFVRRSAGSQADGHENVNPLISKSGGRVHRLQMLDGRR